MPEGRPGLQLEPGRRIVAMRVWTLPGLYTVASLVAAIAIPRLESIYLPETSYGMSMAVAASFYSSVASGILALTAIVFSIAFVMVQFSAVAYSPRLVLTFAGSPELYHALGVFIATFVYSLATLAWVGRGGTETVPPVSTVIVILLLLLSMGVFAWLIRYLTKLQVTEVLETVGSQGRIVIEQHVAFLDRFKFTPTDKGGVPAQGGARVVYRGPPTIVTSVAFERLLAVAQRYATRLSLHVCVGDTLLDGDLVLSAGTPAGPTAEEVMPLIHHDRERTLEQDPRFPIRLLVDIAIKALSPAINDPTTAVQAIDQIEDLMRRLGKVPLGPVRFHAAGEEASVEVPLPTWQAFMALAFDEIAQYGAESVQVMRRLHAAMRGLAEHVPAERRDVVATYRAYIERSVQDAKMDEFNKSLARVPDVQGLGAGRD
jgi:uncharacterized membrane protein